MHQEGGSHQDFSYLFLPVPGIFFHEIIVFFQHFSSCLVVDHHTGQARALDGHGGGLHHLLRSGRHRGVHGFHRGDMLVYGRKNMEDMEHSFQILYARTIVFMTYQPMLGLE